VSCFNAFEFDGNFLSGSHVCAKINITKGPAPDLPPQTVLASYAKLHLSISFLSLRLKDSSTGIGMGSDPPCDDVLKVEGMRSSTETWTHQKVLLAVRWTRLNTAITVAPSLQLSYVVRYCMYVLSVWVASFGTYRYVLYVRACTAVLLTGIMIMWLRNYCTYVPVPG